MRTKPIIAAALLATAGTAAAACRLGQRLDYFAVFCILHGGYGRLQGKRLGHNLQAKRLAQNSLDARLV